MQGYHGAHAVRLLCFFVMGKPGDISRHSMPHPVELVPLGAHRHLLLEKQRAWFIVSNRRWTDYNATDIRYATSIGLL